MVFQIFTTVIFFIAVLHVFLSNHFLKLAHLLEKERGNTSLAVSLYTFLGNPAIVFGFWLIPVLIVMAIKEGGEGTYQFLKTIDLLEPFAYFVLVAIATVRPLQKLFYTFMQKIAGICRRHFLFFWIGIILISSLLTGLFSGIAIMVLICTYLSSSFFPLKPNTKLIYFTFSLLLLGMSMGTTILPVNFSFFQNLINGNWSHVETFYVFGWKIFIGLFCVCFIVGSFFKKELNRLEKKVVKAKKTSPTKFREWFYAVLFFIASIGKENVFILLIILAFIIILHKPFYRLKGEEGKLELYFPIIIAFFTYTLEIHTSLQKWWVLPLFEQASALTSYGYAFLLTGLNEHVPLQALKVIYQNATPNVQFFSFLGVLAGGGLTLIAKSENIIAKLKLRRHFPHKAISPLVHLFIAIPLGLFLSAIVVFLHYLVGVR